MVKRTGGVRKKTRHKLQKRPRDRGKVKVTNILREFKIGDKVLLKFEPAMHGGMPHPRYKGKEGTVLEQRGRAYVIAVKDLNSLKSVVCAPAHLRLVR